MDVLVHDVGELTRQVVFMLADTAFSEGQSKIGLLLQAIYRGKTLFLLDAKEVPLGKSRICDIRNTSAEGREGGDEEADVRGHGQATGGA